MSEMRQIVGMLREGGNGQVSRSPMPTLDDLPALAAEFERAGLPVEVDVLGIRRQVPSGIDLAAYRVVQEALTNCLKHAHATRGERHPDLPRGGRRDRGRRRRQAAGVRRRLAAAPVTA